MEKRIIVGLDNLDEVVDYLKDLLPVCSIFTFTGSLGAGKTTLVRSLLKKVGIKEHITSPTFTYLNVYKNEEGKMFCHFDLYRLRSLEDFVFAGFAEYLDDDNNYVFIEWPEILEDFLAKNNKNVCSVSIHHKGHDKREFIITHT